MNHPVDELSDQRAEEELLEEIVSYRRDVTGIENTIFISPKGNTRHAPRIKIAIDPPLSVDPRGRAPPATEADLTPPRRSKTASVAIVDGTVIAGEAPTRLIEQVRRFLDANRDVLLDYWEYRIDTEELRRRLKAI
jgi:hypothetical protein